MPKGSAEPRVHIVGANNNTASVRTIEKINSTHTPEIVIALCGPIGSPLHTVAEEFARILTKGFAYNQAEIIRLSRFIEDKKGKSKATSAYDRVRDLIRKGDELRHEHGSSVLAELAIAQISLDRQRHLKANGNVAFKPRRTCHIIDSIKNQEELEVLRLVYRDMLYVVGIYSPQENRVEKLTKRGMTLSQVHQLIDTDSGEEFAHGQTVRDTFPYSDFFLRVDATQEIDVRVSRFLDLILGTKVVPPTAAETAMHMAHSAAGGSACLSRQVGAAITDADGNLLSVGWNDVPKFGGSLYTSDPTDPTAKNDQRCWNQDGKLCHNDKEKMLIAGLLAEGLVAAKVITKNKKTEASSAILKSSSVKNLIEFSRSVHAELHAIINAGAQSRGSLTGGKMFVTTYPCHSCARHIIAAGIHEVYFIEPYRKSLALRLHGDAITESESDQSKVRILPYDGISPARYTGLFRVPIDSRKINGQLKNTPLELSTPRYAKTLEAFPTLEALVVKGLERKIYWKLRWKNERERNTIDLRLREDRCDGQRSIHTKIVSIRRFGL